MSAVNHVKLADQAEELITGFKLAAARELLGPLDSDAIPIAQRTRFANLCRRAGLDDLALKLFHVWIDDKNQARAEDRVEYATCLRKVGLVHEALRILRLAETSASSLLHQSFCYIQIWDYHRSADILLEALGAKPDDKTSRLLRINLVASLVFVDKLDQALKWLEPLEQECAKTSRHLHIMCRLQRAQILFRLGRFEESLQLLDQLTLDTAQESNAPKMLIEKWRVLARIVLEPSPENFAGLSQLRAAARRQKQWETLRGIDAEAAMALNDTQMVTHVYYGTPFPALRRKLAASAVGASIPNPYFLRDGRSEDCQELVINGMTGENMPFKYGSLQYRAVLYLLSDSYQPWTHYRIFDGLFNDQAFDPVTSPRRVYQLTARIRIACQRPDVPLEMKATEHGYRLRVKRGGRVIIFDDMRFSSAHHLILELLRKEFVDRPFSAADLKGIAPVNQAQGQRIMRVLVEEGHAVSVDDSRRHRRYRLKTV